MKELNLFKIAAALYSLSMFSGMFIQFMIYVYRAKELKLLIDDLTEWVQQRKYSRVRERVAEMNDLN